MRALEAKRVSVNLMYAEAQVALDLGDAEYLVNLSDRMSSWNVGGWRTVKAMGLRTRGWTREALLL